MDSSDDLATRLDELIRLMRISNNLAALGPPSQKSQKQRIYHLDKAGFSSRAIAELIGTTPNSVSVVLSARKRELKQGKRKGRSNKQAADAAGEEINE